MFKDYNNHLRDSMVKNQLYFIMNDDDNRHLQNNFDSNIAFDTAFFKIKRYHKGYRFF